MFHICGRGFPNSNLWMIPISGEEVGEASMPPESVRPVATWSESASYKEIKKIFSSVTRYLGDVDLLLEGIRPRGEKIEQLCLHLARGEWNEISLKYDLQWDDLPKDALRAFYEGKISMEQFSTISFFWSLKKTSKSPIEVVPLFRGNEVNPKARDLIAETMKKSGLLQGRCPDFLDSSERVSFFARMHSAPKSEQYFFLCREEPGFFIGPISTITQEIYLRAGINVFNRSSCNGIDWEMTPSFSMMQQFLRTYAGDLAIKITPVIGLSSVEDIVVNLKTGTRDMALPFPGVFIPDSADTLKAPKYRDFLLHDLYHTILCSEIPHEVRPTFSLLADIILELKESASDRRVVAFLDEFFHRIVDNEHPAFRKHNEEITGYKGISIELKFIWSFLFQYQNAITRLTRAPREEISLSDLSQISLILETAGVFDRFFELCQEKGCFSSFGMGLILTPLLNFLEEGASDFQKIIVIHLWKDPANIPLLAETIIDNRILQGIRILQSDKEELIKFIIAAPRPTTIEECNLLFPTISEKVEACKNIVVATQVKGVLEHWGNIEVRKVFCKGCLERSETQGLNFSARQIELFEALVMSRDVIEDEKALYAFVKETLNTALQFT